MSYADPQSITIDGQTTSLPKVEGPSGGRSQYRGVESTGNEIVLTASHQSGKRIRRVLRLDVTVPVVDDLYLSNVKGPESCSIYTVFDVPRYAGSPVFTASGVKLIWDGYDALLNASSDVLITKLLAGES